MDDDKPRMADGPMDPRPQGAVEDRPVPVAATAAEDLPGTSAAQPGARPAAAEGGRTFSEAEVSAIVQRRLARERDKVDALVRGEFEQTLLARERQVLAKELRAEGRERLAAAGLPGEAALLLCCDSEEAFEGSYKTLVSLFGPVLDEAVNREVMRRFTIAGGPPRRAERADSAQERLREAFWPKRAAD